VIFIRHLAELRESSPRAHNERKGLISTVMHSRTLAQPCVSEVPYERASISVPLL
jgi:hypothetical protein